MIHSVYVLVGRLVGFFSLKKTDFLIDVIRCCGTFTIFSVIVYGVFLTITTQIEGCEVQDTSTCRYCI